MDKRRRRHILRSIWLGLVVIGAGTVGYMVIEHQSFIDSFYMTAITVIARAVEEGAEKRLEPAGADRVLNPYREGGTRLALTALKPNVTDFLEASLMGSSVELELAEVVVHPSSDLVGKTLAGAEVRQRFGIIVVALKNSERSIFNPGPEERIEAGDVLVALGPLQALESIEKATQ